MYGTKGEGSPSDRLWNKLNTNAKHDIFIVLSTLCFLNGLPRECPSQTTRSQTSAEICADGSENNMVCRPCLFRTTQSKPSWPGASPLCPTPVATLECPKIRPSDRRDTNGGWWLSTNFRHRQRALRRPALCNRKRCAGKCVFPEDRL